MNYEKRLLAAARLVQLDVVEHLPTAEEVAKKSKEWGVTGQLKPHQAQGVSWLVHRYVRGVNETRSFSQPLLYPVISSFFCSTCRWMKFAILTLTESILQSGCTLMGLICRADQRPLIVHTEVEAAQVS
eukprot:Gb_15025 [translate_table: standard]